MTGQSGGTVTEVILCPHPSWLDAMPSPADPADRPDLATDRSAVHEAGESPAPQPASDAQDETRTASPPTPQAFELGATVAAPTGMFQPPQGGPSVGPSGNAASGQALRDLNDWVDHNRDKVDVGEYKLLRSLGTGAYGAVWEAINFETGEHVAIKFLTAGDQRWEALLDEVKFLQALEGTHGIVTVKQVHRGTAHQPPYYVMPLATAGSLTDLLKAPDSLQGGPPSGRLPQQGIPLAEAVRLFTRVATALAAVHRRGIHHCDLKPRNILLHRAQPSDPVEPLIADFGQAHLATDDTPALGTFFYMPPDQAVAGLRKTRSDSGWDVYALGAVLYELLTGEPPRKTESLVRELRGTSHLESKLDAYRSGVAKAPVPIAHRAVADPLLAGLIDKCLSLNPVDRPRDAGEVVRLLKHRAWWRQVRPLLTLGTVGTSLFILLMASISVFVANRVYNDSKKTVGQEIEGSLARTGWYGMTLVDKGLQDHIGFIEQQAADCPDDVRQAMLKAATAAEKAGPPQGGVAQATAAIGDRSEYDGWLTKVQRRSRGRWVDDTPRSVALVLSTSGEGPAHAYILARSDPNSDPATDRVRNARIYNLDLAFRDYFHGGGNRFDKPGEPFPVLRHTHISHTYRSRLADRPWQVDIITPVWSGPDRTGRVLGLLSIGLRIDALKSQIEMPADLLAKIPTIARGIGAYVVNDRECWVWHEAGMAQLAADADKVKPILRDPDNLPELARARGKDAEDADDYVPWHHLKDGIEYYSDRYTDPVESRETGSARKIAHTVPFLPYTHSVYRDTPDEKYGHIGDRRWGFVVQVDEATALRPLMDLRHDLFWAGSVMVITLAALAVVLWIWLFRLLRGWELAGHG